MRKFNYKKLISLFLAMLLLCTVFISSACDGCNGDEEPELPTEAEHEITDKFVLPEYHSKCEYTILIPSGTLDDNMKVAINELQLGIKACAGYEMKTTTEYVEGQKYLSVGKTALYEANKEAVDGNGLATIDVRLLTVDDSVIMIGGKSEYTVYAVYDFMEISFGFKWYSPFDYDVEQSKTISLYKFDYEDAPDIQRRNFHQWEYWAEDASTSVDVITRNRRMRVQQFEEDYVVAGHTMVNVIMKHDLYYDEHPEWFTVSKDSVQGIETGQLCLTNEELFPVFIERCKELIRANPDNEHFMLGMDDNWGYCKGAQYTEENRHKCTCVEQAIANSASGNSSERAGNFIIFANKVSRVINEWIKEEFNDPNKEMKFTIYAYYHNLVPPVKLDGNGNYIPVNENVILDDNISVMYAPLQNDFSYSIDDPRNETISKMCKQWLAITKNMYMYSYATAYGAPLLPMNDLTTMGGSYSFAGQQGFYGYLEEASTYYRTPSMQRLKNYISSQLWWDTTKSVDDVAFEFIDYYYGPVAYEFKEYYKALKQFQIYQINEMGLKVPIQSVAYGDAKYWPKDAADSFNRMIDSMIDKLGFLKQENPKTYEEYFARINTEKIWIYYLYLENYSGQFNVSTKRDMIDFVEKYATEYNVCMRQVPNLVEKWKTLL